MMKFGAQQMKRKLFWILLGGSVVVIVADFAFNIGGLRHIVDGSGGTHVGAATADGDDHDRAIARRCCGFDQEWCG